MTSHISPTSDPRYADDARDAYDGLSPAEAEEEWRERQMNDKTREAGA